MKQYIRFGFIPENEQSKNYLTGKREKGVSVYDVFIKDDEYLPVMPQWKGGACVTMSGCFRDTIPAFIVTGDEVGVGSENEPVLKNIRIVKRLEKKNDPQK